MILNRKDNMTAFYGNGNLRVAYDIFGNQFEREMQREKAINFLLRTAIEYSKLENDLDQLSNQSEKKDK